MRRIALLAVSQCFSVIAFCQSMIPSGVSQPSSDQSPAAQGLFEANWGQFAQAFPLQKTRACSRPDVQTKSAPRSNANQLFQTPCLNPQVFTLTAQNNAQTSLLPNSQYPHAKSIPIPTQWPNAKAEPIPTTWSNLKIVPIAQNNPGSMSAK